MDTKLLTERLRLMGLLPLVVHKTPLTALDYTDHSRQLITECSDAELDNICDLLARFVATFEKETVEMTKNT